MKKEAEEPTEEIEKMPEKETNVQEQDGYGNPIICKLSSKKNVVIQDYKGKKLVSMRECYEKDGKSFPSSKGISLTKEQWEVLKTSIPAVEEGINKMESKLGD